MRKLQKLSLICIFFVFSIGAISFLACSTDPNEQANKLYVEAIEIWQNAKIKADNYSKAYESHKEAVKKIDRIISKYASSNIAVGLMSGQTRIAGMTLNEFQNLKGSLKSFAEAEKQPLACALLIVGTDSKARVLADIAGKYAQAGQTEKATQILFQALETANTIEGANSKARVLADIAGKYADAGQPEKATQILSQALETAKTIKDADSKVWVLADIAGKYADAGQFNKALEIAKTFKDADSFIDHQSGWPTGRTIADAVWEAKALADIAGKYAQAGQFNQALEIAKTFKDADSKTRVLADIAGKYADAGQPEKAAQVLSQAFETARTIEYASSKAWALVDIAGKYADAGQTEKATQILSQALETAKTFKDADSKVWVLADIAINIEIKYAKTRQQPGEKDMAILRDIVHTVYPMKLLWE